MAIRRQQYAKELERQLAKGTSPKEAHETAVEKSIIKKPVKKLKRKIQPSRRRAKKKKNWVSRLKENVRLLVKGPTIRTRAIEKGLKRSITKKEIAKFKRKK